ncbi:MAG: hypothetical protein IPK26_28365 [Planctomycetes bacterium]|nr:hypothetical protein [Planctomycetota bacterium]
MRPDSLAVVLIGALSASGVALAQDQTTLADILTGVKSSAAELRNDDGQVADYLARIAPDSSLVRFLRDLNLRFKTFEDQDGTARLGLEYEFSKTITRSGAEDEGGFDFSTTLTGRGNVAFAQDANPTSFLETGLQLHLFRQGFHSASDIVIDEATQTRNQALLTRIGQDDLDPTEYRQTTEWRELVDSMRNLLGLETILDISGHGTLETDQTFDNHQAAYGLRLAFGVKEWRPDALLSKLNVFDFPFALTRVLTDTDPTFSPTGRSLPMFLAGIDLVDPSGNEARAAIGEDDAYPRFHAEVTMKSLVGVISGSPIWTSMGWRYYRDLDAAAAVEAADLDEHSYFLARLDLPKGLFASYAAGRLPFDVEDTSRVELGFHVHF